MSSSSSHVIADRFRKHRTSRASGNVLTQYLIMIYECSSKTVRSFQACVHGYILVTSGATPSRSNRATPLENSKHCVIRTITSGMVNYHMKSCQHMWKFVGYLIDAFFLHRPVFSCLTDEACSSSSSSCMLPQHLPATRL